MSNNSRFTEEQIAEEIQRYLRDVKAGRRQFRKLGLMAAAATTATNLPVDALVPNKLMKEFEDAVSKTKEQLTAIAIRNLVQRDIAQHNLTISDEARKQRIEKKRELKALKKKTKTNR